MKQERLLEESEVYWSVHNTQKEQQRVKKPEESGQVENSDSTPSERLVERLSERVIET